MQLNRCRKLTTLDSDVGLFQILAIPYASKVTDVTIKPLYKDDSYAYVEFKWRDPIQLINQNYVFRILVSDSDGVPLKREYAYTTQVQT